MAGDREARQFALAMAQVADSTKCLDIMVLHVAPLVSWTSYLMICSVASKPQLVATLVRMEKAAVEDWGKQRQNNPGNSPWELLDFGDVVLHVFSSEQRAYYDIESFYAAAEEVGCYAPPQCTHVCMHFPGPPWPTISNTEPGCC